MSLFRLLIICSSWRLRLHTPSTVLMTLTMAMLSLSSTIHAIASHNGIRTVFGNSQSDLNSKLLKPRPYYPAFHRQPVFLPGIRRQHEVKEEGNEEKVKESEPSSSSSSTQMEAQGPSHHHHPHAPTEMVHHHHPHPNMEFHDANGEDEVKPNTGEDEDDLSPLEEAVKDLTRIERLIPIINDLTFITLVVLHLPVIIPTILIPLSFFVVGALLIPIVRVNYFINHEDDGEDGRRSIF